jgi:hypothetical protein
MLDDAELIELTLEWLGSGSVARQVLVTNAETLFFARSISLETAHRRRRGQAESRHKPT